MYIINNKFKAIRTAQVPNDSFRLVLYMQPTIKIHFFIHPTARTFTFEKYIKRINR